VSRQDEIIFIKKLWTSTISTIPSLHVAIVVICSICGNCGIVALWHCGICGICGHCGHCELCGLSLEGLCCHGLSAEYAVGFMGSSVQCSILEVCLKQLATDSLAQAFIFLEFILI
jgi:hypothetical protein